MATQDGKRCVCILQNGKSKAKECTKERALKKFYKSRRFQSGWGIAVCCWLRVQSKNRPSVKHSEWFYYSGKTADPTVFLFYFFQYLKISKLIKRKERGEREKGRKKEAIPRIQVHCLKNVLSDTNMCLWMWIGDVLCCDPRRHLSMLWVQGIMYKERERVPSHSQDRWGGREQWSSWRALKEDEEDYGKVPFGSHEYLPREVVGICTTYEEYSWIQMGEENTDIICKK